MRIISGKHGGRRIASPASQSIRPTVDRVRESIFSIIGDLSDAVVIDGYAGTGALGCEALSRGARKAWFFDKSREGIALVRENLEILGETDAGVVLQSGFATGLSAVTEEVDVVFLDPPYGTGEVDVALTALAENPRIRKDCLIVIEQESREEAPEHPGFEFDEARRYGNTRVTFLYRA